MNRNPSTNNIIVEIASASGGADVPVNGNVASGATDSGNPVKTGGVYRATPITLTDGERGDTQMDAAGNTNMNMGTLLNGEQTSPIKYMRAIPAGTPTRITTATTTLALTGPGIITEIIFGKRVATGVTTVYDALTATGSPILVITEGAAILSDTPQNTGHGIKLSIGCCVVTSQAEDITFVIAIP